MSSSQNEKSQSPKNDWESPFPEREKRQQEQIKEWESRHRAYKPEIMTEWENEAQVRGLHRYSSMLYESLCKIMIKLLLRDGKFNLMYVGTFELTKVNTKRLKVSHIKTDLMRRAWPYSDGEYVYSYPSFRVKYTPSPYIIKSIREIMAGKKLDEQWKAGFSSDGVEINRTRPEDIHIQKPKEVVWRENIKNILDRRESSNESAMFITHFNNNETIGDHEITPWAFWDETAAAARRALAENKMEYVDSDNSDIETIREQLGGFDWE